MELWRTLNRLINRIDQKLKLVVRYLERPNREKKVQIQKFEYIDIVFGSTFKRGLTVTTNWN